MHTFHALVGDSRSSFLWWQMCLRAGLIFFYGLLLIRVAGLRAFGKQTPLDIVVAVIIGSNLSRALTGTAPLLSTMAATGVMLGLYWAVVHLVQYNRTLGWLVKGEAVRLIRDGELDRSRARRHGVSDRDLEEAARSSGLRGLDEVGSATLERSGKISVVGRG